MRFAHPWLLLLLLLVPLALWLGARRTASAPVSSALVFGGLRPTARQRIAWLPLALRAIAAVLVIVALARPQGGVGRTRVSTEGIALMLVVDRSGSMGEALNFRGQPMSRLEAVKRVFREFVLGDGETLPGRPNDLLGLVAFARSAETVCPLVRDPAALARLSDTLAIAQSRAENATAIGDGVALAAARLQKAEEDLAQREAQVRAGSAAVEEDVKPEFAITSKVIVLLTDGRANAGDITPMQAAQLAAEWGIRIYAIGIGDDVQGMIRRSDGAFVIRGGGGVDMETLQAMAQETGGRAWVAGDADALRDAYAEIDRLEKTRMDSVEYTDYEERFTPLALGAMLALGLDALLVATLLRRSP